MLYIARLNADFLKIFSFLVISASSQSFKVTCFGNHHVIQSFIIIWKIWYGLLFLKNDSPKFYLLLITRIIQFSCTGDYVFIDMDNPDELGIPMALIPTAIGGVQPDQNFQLIGIGAYNAGHYVAMCRIQSGLWFEFDDMDTQNTFRRVENYDINKIIFPHLCVYLKG